MNRISTYGVLALLAFVSATLGNEAKGEGGIPNFRAAHGYGRGLTEMVDLTKLEGFDKVRTSKDLAKFSSKVPGAVGFTAHPSFESGEHRFAHAVLWYTNLTPTTESWALFLFDEKEAKKQPGEAATDAALSAAEAKVTARLEIAQERIDEGGQNGVVLLGDRDEREVVAREREREVVARAVLRLGGLFQHTGKFGNGQHTGKIGTGCGGCRSVVPGGTPTRCGLGIQDKEHWSCCGSLEKDGFCRYWELLLANEQAEQGGGAKGD